ncbi:MAG: ABC transporter permease subunit [Geminicoccaceae bacterium]
MLDTALSLNDLRFLMLGAGWTLLITAISVTAGTLLGVLFGVARAQTPVWVSLPIGFVLDIFRSVPLLIQLVLFNSFIPILGLRATPFSVSCLVLALYTSAYCSEIVRGGVAAVPQTTRRAARSLGMTWGRTWSRSSFPWRFG